MDAMALVCTPTWELANNHGRGDIDDVFEGRVGVIYSGVDASACDNDDNDMLGKNDDNMVNDYMSMGDDNHDLVKEDHVKHDNINMMMLCDFIMMWVIW